jgi:hypothetical protein
LHLAHNGPRICSCTEPARKSRSKTAALPVASVTFAALYNRLRTFAAISSK